MAAVTAIASDATTNALSQKRKLRWRQPEGAIMISRHAATNRRYRLARREAVKGIDNCFLIVVPRVLTLKM
jgi:hypothetical protein